MIKNNKPTLDQDINGTKVMHQSNFLNVSRIIPLAANVKKNSNALISLPITNIQHL